MRKSKADKIVERVFITLSNISKDTAFAHKEKALPFELLDKIIIFLPLFDQLCFFSFAFSNFR